MSMAVGLRNRGSKVGDNRQCLRAKTNRKSETLKNYNLKLN